MNEIIVSNLIVIFVCQMASDVCRLLYEKGVKKAKGFERAYMFCKWIWIVAFVVDFVRGRI